MKRRNGIIKGKQGDLNMENIIAIAISALLSGVVGVVISNWYHARAEKRKLKLAVLHQLMGNRNYLVGQKFTEAINNVFVVFHDSQTVLSELKIFHAFVISSVSKEQLNNQLLKLFKAMCADLKIDIAQLDDSFFLIAFNVRTENDKGEQPCYGNQSN